MNLISLFYVKCDYVIWNYFQYLLLGITKKIEFYCFTIIFSYYNLLKEIIAKKCFISKSLLHNKHVNNYNIYWFVMKSKSTMFFFYNMLWSLCLQGTSSHLIADLLHTSLQKYDSLKRVNIVWNVCFDGFSFSQFTKGIKNLVTMKDTFLNKLYWNYLLFNLKKCWSMFQPSIYRQHCKHQNSYKAYSVGEMC